MFQPECENFLLSMAKVRGEAQEREVRNPSNLDPRKYADVGQLNTTAPACFELADNALWKDQFGIKSGQKMEQAGLMEVLNWRCIGDDLRHSRGLAATRLLSA